MKRVLIERETGRLCDIVSPANEFSVAAGLQWFDAPDDVSHETHVFENGTVVLKPAKSLPERKADKLVEMEKARKRTIDTLPLVRVAGKDYPATPEYREVITGIARRSVAGRPIPATLRGVDGVPQALNGVLVSKIDDAITEAVQAAWDRYWQRFDAVQAAATVAEVDVVVW